MAKKRTQQPAAPSSLPHEHADALLDELTAARQKIFETTKNGNLHELDGRFHHFGSTHWDFACGHECEHLTPEVRLVCTDLAPHAYCLRCLLQAHNLRGVAIIDHAERLRSHAQRSSPTDVAAMARHYATLLETHVQLHSEYAERMLSLFFDAPSALLYAYIRAALSASPKEWIYADGHRSVFERALQVAWLAADIVGESDPGIRGLAKLAGQRGLYGDVWEHDRRQ